MVPSKKPPRRPPPWWAAQLYQGLAAGRYAVQWLPELLRLYDAVVEDDGEEAAFDWLLRELALSMKPSLTVRALPILRLIYRVWKTYRRVAGE